MRRAGQGHLRHEVRQRVHEWDNIRTALLLCLGSSDCTTSSWCQPAALVTDDSSTLGHNALLKVQAMEVAGVTLAKVRIEGVLPHKFE